MPKPKGASTKMTGTPNDGAGALRKNIVAHLRRRIRELQASESNSAAHGHYISAEGYRDRCTEAESILTFVQSTDDRASQRKGGLGRR